MGCGEEHLGILRFNSLVEVPKARKEEGSRWFGKEQVWKKEKG